MLRYSSGTQKAVLAYLYWISGMAPPCDIESFRGATRKAIHTRTT